MKNKDNIDWDGYRSQLFLNPNTVNLNAGSTSPGIRPVYAAAAKYREIQATEPVSFLWGETLKLIEHSRRVLADYVTAPRDNLFFFKNASTAADTVLNSVELGPGDEVLTFGHEYIHILSHLNVLAKKQGFTVRKISLPDALSAPQYTPDDVVEMIRNAISPKTRLLLASHISFTHGVKFPAEDICNMCRNAGVLTLIDGAHAVGLTDLNLESMGADFYAGACNKWLQNPVGSAFLYTRKEHFEKLRPLTVTGYFSEDQKNWWDLLFPEGPTNFTYGIEYQGTEDRVAQIVLPESLKFRLEIGEQAIRQKQLDLASYSSNQLAEFGLKSLSHSHPDMRSCMVSYKIPQINVLKSILHFRNQGKLEVAIPYDEDGNVFLRISHSWWNSEREFDQLANFIKDVNWQDLA